MKFLILLSILVVANGYVNADISQKYIPMEKVPTINNIPRVHQIKREKLESNINPYIVGGDVATPHSLPYDAALTIDNGFFCGGALISDTFVLTAGHCIYKAYLVITQLGAQNRTFNEIPQQRFETSGSNNIIIHEDYNPDSLANDIGLVRLLRPATLSASVQPIRLPTVVDDDLGAGVPVEISGWGLTSGDTTSPKSDVLKVAEVYTIANSECILIYGSVRVTDATLCTSSVPGDGICFGDSGGPLTYDGGAGKVHRGIVSFVPISGCESKEPNGFIRTTHYLDWIQGHLASK